MITTKYKDIEICHEIRYDSEWWTIECDFGTYENKELTKVKEWIDRKLKEQFKRYSIIYEWGGITVGEVTSEVGEELWVKSKYGRSKIPKVNIVIQTPEKMEIFNQIKEIEKELDIYKRNKESEIKELRSELFETRITDA